MMVVPQPRASYLLVKDLRRVTRQTSQIVHGVNIHLNCLVIAIQVLYGLQVYSIDVVKATIHLRNESIPKVNRIVLTTRTVHRFCNIKGNYFLPYTM